MSPLSPQRILVTGSTGYVGGRLVPRLVADGHEVRTTYTDPEKPAPWFVGTFPEQVTRVKMDVSDADEVRAAVEGIDVVYYLVHGMGGDNFVETDRRAATIMAEAASDAGVSRIIYLSGIVPPVDKDDLSDHITSRHEVEQILSGSTASTITLRAAVILGSGSTSFEVVRQVSERVPLQTVPTWMDSDVQAIALVDVIEALVGALAPGLTTRSYDVGGPDRLSYGELLERYAALAGLTRPQVMIPLLPTQLVGTLVGSLTDVPNSTVEALVESLHHDMVSADADFRSDLLPAGHHLIGLDEAITRALGTETDAPPADRDPMGPMPQDPGWASGGDGRGTVAKVVDAVKDVVADPVGWVPRD